MSTADGMNGEASARNVEQSREGLNNSPEHNDCGKHRAPDAGGARPKVKNLVCNIPNGIGAVSDDAAKVNNIVSLTENLMSELDESNASSSGISKLNNGLNFSCANGVENSSGIGSCLHNSVNYHAAVDKCPLKLRSCSNKDNNLDLSNGCYHHESRRRVTRSWDEADGSSSDTGNDGEDGLSADECCIYTYKGDQMADLPSSFFTLDVLARTGEQGPSTEGARKEDGDVEVRVGDRTGGGSSPEMDFLEMDFDPGPSCEQDSGEDSDCCDIQDEEVGAVYPGHDFEPNLEMDCGADSHCHNDLSATSQDNDLRNASASVLCAINTPEEHPGAHSSSPQPTWTLPHSRSSDSNLGGGASSTIVRPAGCWPPRDSWGRHCTSGDLCSPGEATDLECETWGETMVMWNASNLRVQNEGGLVDTRKYNLHSALYHCIMAKRLVLDKQASFSSDGDETNMDGQLDGSPEHGQIGMERTMIWSEQEACVKQVTQISTSACGATAAVNVLLACNIPFCLDRVKEGVNTRLRAESAPLPEYLFSRSVAGATHVDIIRGLEHASEGSLYGRFFSMYPDRIVSLTRWLAYWMKKGAVPIATLNLQNGIAPGSPVPDAWHHQMVFGVGPRGIYLTNPVECVSEAALWPQLCSPSVLLVRRSDVLARWNEHASLRPLMTHPDHRWKTMNVLGQVVNIIRESTCTRVQTQGWVVTQHVNIPAAYSSGITLMIRRESPGYEELRSAPELPLLEQEQQ